MEASDACLEYNLTLGTSRHTASVTGLVDDKANGQMEKQYALMLRLPVPLVTILATECAPSSNDLYTTPQVA